MKMIMVVDCNWGIGRNNGLLVHLPGDLKYFKKRTEGKTLIMGRKTLESLPGGKPLPGRPHIILSSKNECIKGMEDQCKAVPSLEALFKIVDPQKSDDYYVAGGAEVYKQLLPFCDTVYITKIDEAFEADKYFMCLDDEKDFEKVWESELQEEKGLTYYFTEYKRK